LIIPFIGFLTLFLFILSHFWANLAFAFIAKQHGCGRRRAAERLPNSFRLTAPKPPWVKDEVIRLKALMSDGSCRKIAAVFNAQKPVVCRQVLRKNVSKMDYFLPHDGKEAKFSLWF